MKPTVFFATVLLVCCASNERHQDTVGDAYMTKQLVSPPMQLEVARYRCRVTEPETGTVVTADVSKRDTTDVVFRLEVGQVTKVEVSQVSLQSELYHSPLLSYEGRTWMAKVNRGTASFIVAAVGKNGNNVYMDESMYTSCSWRVGEDKNTLKCFPEF